MSRREITGFSNPTVKFLRSLREKKHRKAAGKFLAEGLRLLTDARESGHIPEILVMAKGREPHALLAALESYGLLVPRPNGGYDTDAVVIAPSNPIVSIGPVMAVPGVREATMARRDRCVAISPIVGGKALKGPADRMLEELGIRYIAAHSPEAKGRIERFWQLPKYTALHEPQRTNDGSKRGSQFMAHICYKISTHFFNLLSIGEITNNHQNQFWLIL